MPRCRFGGESAMLGGALLRSACGNAPTAPALSDVSLGRFFFVTSEVFVAAFGGGEGGEGADGA